MSVRDIRKTQFCAQFLTTVFCVFIFIGLFQVKVQWRWRLSNIIQAPGPALSSEISRKCYIPQVEKLFIFLPKLSLYWLWDIIFPHPFYDDDDDDDDNDDDDDDDDDYNDGDSLVIKRKDWEWTITISKHDDAIKCPEFKFDKWKLYCVYIFLPTSVFVCLFPYRLEQNGGQASFKTDGQALSTIRYCKNNWIVL